MRIVFLCNSGFGNRCSMLLHTFEYSEDLLDIEFQVNLHINTLSL